MPLLNIQTQPIRKAVKELLTPLKTLRQLHPIVQQEPEKAAELIELQSKTITTLSTLIDGLLNELDNTAIIANRLQHSIDTTEVVKNDRVIEN